MTMTKPGEHVLILLFRKSYNELAIVKGTGFFAFLV